MPYMVGMLGRDATSRAGRRRGRCWRRRLLEHSSDGCDGEVQACAGQGLDDFSLAHRRAKELQSPHDVPDELRELVDRLAELDQRTAVRLVGAAHPVGDGRSGHQKTPCGLGERPAAHRAKLQDGHPLDRRVMGPSVGRHVGHSRILDPQFLAQQRQLRFQPLDAEGLLRDAAGLRCLAASLRDGIVRQSDDFQDGALGRILPTRRRGESKGTSRMRIFSQAGRSTKATF